MTDWEEGDIFPATGMSRYMINGQLSPLFLSVDSQDLIGDLIKYKERALNTHIIKVLPKFMLRTPGMKAREKVIDELMERIQSVHTPAQRAGEPRDLADDILSLHASDPQLVPESNLRFAFRRRWLPAFTWGTRILSLCTPWLRSRRFMAGYRRRRMRCSPTGTRPQRISRRKRLT